jgi:DNA-directed RNA polymerase specialized sigma24 family protein
MAIQGVRMMRPSAPSPEEIAGLVALVQDGDEAAFHQLYVAYATTIRIALAPYRGDRELYDDLVIEVYAIFRRLALRYDPERSASFTTFMAAALPRALASAARRELREARHATAFSNLRTKGGEIAFSGGG